MDKATQYDDFAAVKARLEEIVEAVSDDQLPLDDALDLYEEAVNLGLRVSDLLEENISADELAHAADGEDDAKALVSPGEGEEAGAESASPQENVSSSGE